MSVRRLSNSTISTQGRGKSSTFIAGYSPAIDEMDLISRVVVGADGAATITFSNIPQTYQHLQIRMVAKSALTVGSVGDITFNSDTGNNYAYHAFFGDGASASFENGVSRANIPAVRMTPLSNSNIYAAHIIDIIDYRNTLKNKTVRTFKGDDRNGSGAIILETGLWVSLSAINSITITSRSNVFFQQTTATLYGVVA